MVSMVVKPATCSKHSFHGTLHHRPLGSAAEAALSRRSFHSGEVRLLRHGLTPQLVSWFALMRFASSTADDRGWRVLFSAAAHGLRWLAVAASAAVRGARRLPVAASVAAHGPRWLAVAAFAAARGPQSLAAADQVRGPAPS